MQQLRFIFARGQEDRTVYFRNTMQLQALVMLQILQDVIKILMGSNLKPRRRLWV